VTAQVWRRIAVRGALVLMEALWIYAGVAMLVAITVGGGKPSFVGVAAVVVLSFAIARGLQGSDFSLGVLRFWGAFLSLLVFYAVVRLDFFGDARLWDFRWADELFNNTEATLRDDSAAVIGVPLLVFVWVRGVLRGQQSIVFDDVVKGFAIGAFVVALASLFAGVDDDLPREVDFVAVPYIAVGLLAIGLAHASRASDEFERSFSSMWMLAVGGAVGLLGLFAMLFVLVDYEMARDGMLVVGNGLAFVAAGLLYVLVWPLFKIVEVFWEVMAWIMSLWGGDQLEPEDFGDTGQAEPNENERKNIVPDWIETVIRVFVAGGIVAGLVAGIAMLFSRMRRVRRPGEVRESTYQEGRLAADLGNMLDNFFGRFRRSQAHGVTDPARRLYFEMLDAAAARGVERRPMETPLEVSPRISRTFGGDMPPRITSLFDDVRYGAIAVDEAAVRSLRDEWDRLPKG
jgi:hypothetical protein